VADAVVIGAGPNGLVAANMLADAGWDVVVVEEQPEPGGGVRSMPGPAEGFLADACSAFFPLSVASPAIGALELQWHGLRWVHAPTVLAHPLLDGRAAVLSRDLTETAAGLDALGAGDGAAWRRLYALWRQVGERLLEALCTPFPPVRAGASLALRLRLAGLLRFARFAVLPVRRLAQEEFTGPGGSLLLAGLALHVDLTPESAGSGLFGWILSMLGQQFGFPVPEGGAGQLTAAMIHRLESRGGHVVCGARATQILIRRGRAVAVRTADGTEIPARRAVLADVAATKLYGDLVDWQHLPPRLRDDLRRFQWDYATFKVDWALRGPVPWTSTGAVGAGLVHLAASLDEITEFTTQITMGQLPARPFLLVGQMTTADPSRSPAGTESLWAYTHVPQRVRGDAGGTLSGTWDKSETEAFADRMELQLERFAPGFRDRVIAREATTPWQLNAHDANLVDGAIGGGTAGIHQQLVFRPTPGLGRPETPVTGLYLASSSAHPDGGVHGACGANAARAALRESRMHTQWAGAAAVRLAIGR
jgi:phytoene dehydrogenase-like protein